MRSISPNAAPEAFVLRTSSVLKSLFRKASSPALTIIPHFIHISILSATVKLVHLGTKADAILVFPAPKASA